MTDQQDITKSPIADRVENALYGDVIRIKVCRANLDLLFINTKLIQNRREKNRIAQRTFRRKREDERKELQRKIGEAGVAFNKIVQEYQNLASVAKEMRLRIFRLEKENLSLRMGGQGVVEDYAVP